MNELQIFNNPEFGEMRTFIEPDGKVLYCATDAARALGYANPRFSVNKHCPNVSKRSVRVEIGTKADGTPIARPMDLLFAPEGDIYRLMYRAADQSRSPDIKEKAERFGGWIFDEVVPAVMHTGSYTMQPMTTAEQLVAQAQLLVDMEKKLAVVTERMAAAESIALEAGTKAEEAVQKLDTAIKVYSSPDKDHWSEDMGEAIRGIVAVNGWAEPIFRGKLYRELEVSAHKNIDSRLRRLRERKRQSGMTYREAMALTKLDAIAANKELRLIFEGIVKKYQAQAGGANHV